MGTTPTADAYQSLCILPSASSADDHKRSLPNILQRTIARIDGGSHHRFPVPSSRDTVPTQEDTPRGTRIMEFGIGIATSSDSWKLAQRAEELGFTHAWFYDTQMITADCFVAMGAAAMKTSKIRLGTGVLVPSNRIA